MPRAVNARHRGRHRAALLFEWLDEYFRSGEVQDIIHERLLLAPVLRRNLLRPLYLHHAESVDADLLRARYLEAARYG